MKIRCASRWVFASAIPAVLAAQIPLSERLPAADVKPFHDELRRTQRLLATAGDPCTVQYALARTWAAGGQYASAMRALQKAVRLNVGLDPASDEIFSKLRNSREFQTLLSEVRAGTPPVSTSQTAFTVGEPDLFPEGIAYDPIRRRFLLGSTLKHKIIECTDAGACRDFVSPGVNGLSEVLGLKVDGRDGSVWAASNGESGSALFHYSDGGRFIRQFAPPSDQHGHLLNDLVIDRDGDVYVTDSRAGTVYWLSHSSDRLEVLLPALRITAANGIAISGPDNPRLYVAGYPDGITLVDLASMSFHAIGHPRGTCLATIDGLSFYEGSLLAIQNGIMTHRVVRLRLTRDLTAIDKLDVLERRHPQFDGGPTTGAVADGQFVYMANPQLDNVAGGKVKAGASLNPITVLRMSLPR